MLKPIQYNYSYRQPPTRFGNQPDPTVRPKPKLEILLPTLSKIATTRTQTYRNQFQSVLNEAKLYLAPFKDGVVVKDLDETLLDNSAFDILYASGAMSYHDWVTKAEAPAIPEAKAFVDWLGQRGLKLYFVTARRERYRGATLKNLERIGLTPDKYDGIYFKPDHDTRSVNQFKVQAQRDIVSKGHRILAVIGNQESDVENALGKGFKLPNAVYPGS